MNFSGQRVIFFTCYREVLLKNTSDFTSDISTLYNSCGRPRLSNSRRIPWVSRVWISRVVKASVEICQSWSVPRVYTWNNILLLRYVIAVLHSPIHGIHREYIIYKYKRACSSLYTSFLMYDESSRSNAWASLNKASSNNN